MEAGLSHLILAGPVAAIVKVLRNLHELNVRAHILALPWDGQQPLHEEEWAAKNCTVTLLVAQEGSLADFTDQLQGWCAHS
jgi:hypothetical protein